MNPNQAVAFTSPGPNGICNDGDDQLVVMHLNDSASTAPVTLPAGTADGDSTVYSLVTGLALHVILATSTGDLQWMDNNFVPTAIANGVGIGPVMAVAEQNDKVFLSTPTKLYIYTPSTHTLSTTPVVTSDAGKPVRDEATQRQQFGLESQAYAANLTVDTIESTIPGHFDGWRGNARFQLANGQVWQVSDGSSGYHEIDNPKVKIRRGALGAFYLEIEGTNRSPRVRRLQ